jgi:hypothetical protein
MEIAVTGVGSLPGATLTESLVAGGTASGR